RVERGPSRHRRPRLHLRSAAADGADHRLYLRDRFRGRRARCPDQAPRQPRSAVVRESLTQGVSMTKPRPRILGAMALVGAAALTLSACVDSGRTSNPDSEQDESASECPVEVNEDITTSVRLAYQPIPNGDLVV